MKKEIIRLNILFFARWLRATYQFKWVFVEDFFKSQT